MEDFSTSTLTELVTALATIAHTQGLFIATAESCTGGLIASAFTDVSGISSVFLGGIIAYANEIKHTVLTIPQQLLDAYGAVSEPVACMMARNVCTLFSAQFAIATTGIAGPTGGTDTKPVGLTYIALASPMGEHCRRFHFDGNRSENRFSATRAALLFALENISPKTT